MLSLLLLASFSSPSGGGGCPPVAQSQTRRRGGVLLGRADWQRGGLRTVLVLGLVLGLVWRDIQVEAGHRVQLQRRRRQYGGGECSRPIPSKAVSQKRLELDDAYNIQYIIICNV